MKTNDKKKIEIIDLLELTLIKKHRIKRLSTLLQKRKLIKTLKKPKQIINNLVHLKYNSRLGSTETYVSLILLISFSTVNTQLNLLNSSGSLIFSQSAGSVGLKGKKKTNRRLGVKKLLASLKLNFKDLVKKKEHVALHLKNVGKDLKYITKITEKIFIIQSLKTYNKIAFNGCRQKKIKRKKYTKLIKR